MTLVAGIRIMGLLRSPAKVLIALCGGMGQAYNGYTLIFFME
jgi:hypothetical protein